MIASLFLSPLADRRKMPGAVSKLPALGAPHRLLAVLRSTRRRWLHLPSTAGFAANQIGRAPAARMRTARPGQRIAPPATLTAWAPA